MWSVKGTINHVYGPINKKRSTINMEEPFDVEKKCDRMKIEELGSAPFVLTEAFQVTSTAILSPIDPSAIHVLLRDSIAYFPWDIFQQNLLFQAYLHVQLRGSREEVISRVTYWPSHRPFSPQPWRRRAWRRRRQSLWVNQGKALLY